MDKKIDKKMDNKVKVLIPNVISRDNIYKNVDEIRGLCLEEIKKGILDEEEKATYELYIGEYNKYDDKTPYLHDAYYQVGVNIMKEQIEMLEGIVKGRIVEIHKNSGNCHLLKCTIGNERMIVDNDVLNEDEEYEQWKAIIFLTPNAPISGGINFKINREYGISNIKSGLQNVDKKLQNGIINNIKVQSSDMTKWYLDSSIGNKYNRIVVFKKGMFYSHGTPFGIDIDTSNLFQVFSFTVARD